MSITTTAPGGFEGCFASVAMLDLGHSATTPLDCELRCDIWRTEMTPTKNLALEMAERAAKSKADLERAGLSLPARPGFEIPRLPLRISDWNDDKLMQLFVALTRWTDYLAGAIAEAEIEERAAEAILNKAQALVLLRDWGGGRDERVTLAKAQRDIDPEVEKRQDLFDTAHAKRKMISVLFSSTERDAAVVSRELTRRVGRREDHDRRVSRWTP